MRTGLRVAIALLLLAPLPVAFLASVGVRMLGAGLMLQTATFIAAAALLGWAGIKAIDGLGEQVELWKPKR